MKTQKRSPLIWGRRGRRANKEKELLRPSSMRRLLGRQVGDAPAQVALSDQIRKAFAYTRRGRIRRREPWPKMRQKSAGRRSGARPLVVFKGAPNRTINSTVKKKGLAIRRPPESFLILGGEGGLTVYQIRPKGEHGLQLRRQA